jgi:hypothetical protein
MRRFRAWAAWGLRFKVGQLATPFFSRDRRATVAIELQNRLDEVEAVCWQALAIGGRFQEKEPRMLAKSLSSLGKAP